MSITVDIISTKWPRKHVSHDMIVIFVKTERARERKTRLRRRTLILRAFSSIGAQQQQENWDVRLNSPVMSADDTIWILRLFSMVVCTIRVENQHVDRASLKHSLLKGKGVLTWQMHMTHKYRSKNGLYASSVQSSPALEKESKLFPELSNPRKKKIKAINAVGHCPSLRNSAVLILLRLNSPAFPL